MRLEGPESQNVEDRRGMGPGGGFAMGGGIGGVLLLVLALALGIDPSELLQGGGPAPSSYQQQQQAAPGQSDPARRFIAQVLGETERVWSEQFRAQGRTYREPRLVLYSRATQTGCGPAQSQVGPFYCPLDQRIYIDPDFLALMQRQLGARGDFAAAYVIAHEVGHHVQNQFGVLDRVQQLRRSESPQQANAMQVRIELQADCLAGVWANQANRARQILEQGDIEEGINAANAVGDDVLQRRSQGYVVPERFTHGTGAQRVRWFRQGLEKGDLRACDTFRVQQP